MSGTNAERPLAPEEVAGSGRVMGYTDRISYAPGDEVWLHVSTAAERWTGDLVRLHALEIPSAGVERRIEPVHEAATVEAPGMRQRTAVGSYVRVDHAPAIPRSGFTIAFAFQATTAGRDELGTQVMFSHAEHAAGWSVALDRRGLPRLTVGTVSGPVSVSLLEPVRPGQWYELVARIPGELPGRLELAVWPTGAFEANRRTLPQAPPRTASAQLGAPIMHTRSPLLWGCRSLYDGRVPEHAFDGRLENPVLVGDAAAAGTRAELAAHPAVVAAWDLAADIDSERGIPDTRTVTDVSGHGLHGEAVQHPHRLVTSSSWDGGVTDGRFAPGSYAAIHFHRDDLTDCAWQPQARLVLPEGLDSGVFAVRLRDSHGTEDLVPLFVRPRPDAERAPVLLVLPTNSYLAYGNDHVGVDSPRTQVWTQHVPVLDEWELFRNAHRELGRSMYETHTDGSPVFYSSWRRPLLTMRERAYDHNGPVWQFTSDMQIVDWLDRTGRRFDVVTDRDLDEHGSALLGEYSCVLTGSHPEYASKRMLEAYEGYAADGGRLVYLGGNGMYWVTAFDPCDDQVIEIRRWGGTQAWCADPGEYHLSFTGEPGGIWRFRGRAPQKTFGVGFVAAGNPGASAGYLRAAEDPRVAWIFEGVAEPGEVFGAEGVSGGAAGLEIDRADPVLGTADEAVVLATSVGHGDDMLEARENFNMTSRFLGGASNPRVRADLTLVPRAGGGAVLSVGSIAFAGALREGDGESAASRMLGNVVDRFASGDAVIDF